MRIPRKVQGTILVIGLPLFVIGVLAGAQAGSGGKCVWAFPKWIGCAMTAHENLAGGLIGTAGALFAGWLAWSAVREQIEMERLQIMESAMVTYNERLERVRSTINAVEDSVARTAEINTAFRAAHSEGPLGVLMQLHNTGKLHSFGGGKTESRTRRCIEALLTQARPLQKVGGGQAGSQIDEATRVTAAELVELEKSMDQELIELQQQQHTLARHMNSVQQLWR
jgi:hypothetical protein